MKTPTEQLEADLKRLRPSPPSPRLIARLAAQLDEGAAPPERGRCLGFPLWVPLAAAAALVLAAFIVRHRDAELPPPQTAAAHDSGSAAAAADPAVGQAEEPGLKNVYAANYLLDAQEEGIVYVSATTPLRQIRYEFLAASEWRDEAERTRLRMFVPREDVLLLPMNVH